MTARTLVMKTPRRAGRVMTPQVSSTSRWLGICCPAERRNTDIDNVTQAFSSVAWSSIVARLSEAKTKKGFRSLPLR